jgi:hypothetical protein
MQSHADISAGALRIETENCFSWNLISHGFFVKLKNPSGPGGK